MKTLKIACILACIFALAGAASASPVTSPFPTEGGLDPNSSPDDIFAAFHTLMGDLTPPTHQRLLPLLTGPAVFPSEFRTIDGTTNNQINPALGSANTAFLRNTTIGYGDGFGSPGGADQKGARELSNVVNAQADFIPNLKNVSSFIWLWGQFIDHDMTLTPTAVPVQRLNIPVPTCDPVFDSTCVGTKTLSFQRSAFVTVNSVRQQVNANTAFFDASQVYGSDLAKAQELRLLDGSGKLKTGDADLLPFNIDGFPNQPSTDASFFLAGDVRANEHNAMTALQTLFMREHNFWADAFKSGDPTLDDDGIYFRARAIVGAEIELITYRDFIPLLLGKNALTPYTGYNENVDPSIANVFATSAYRFGHSMLPPSLSRLDVNNLSIGDLTLKEATFSPAEVTTVGIEPYLRGVARQQPQEVDAMITDAMRNFPPAFDLASLNIQRGRDHGIPSFNQVRQDYGLAPLTSFAELTSDPVVQARLASAYATIEDVESWVGFIAETHKPRALVGPTAFTVFKEQFERLRDGDRFWYESYLDSATLANVKKQTLGGIIKRNTPITGLQRNVFVLPSPTPTPTPPP